MPFRSQLTRPLLVVIASDARMVPIVIAGGSQGIAGGSQGIAGGSQVDRRGSQVDRRWIAGDRRGSQRDRRGIAEGTKRLVCITRGVFRNDFSQGSIAPINSAK